MEYYSQSILSFYQCLCKNYDCHSSSSSSIPVLGIVAWYSLNILFGLPGSCRPVGHIETFVLEYIEIHCLPDIGYC
jgi:hypothetical protein